MKNSFTKVSAEVTAQIAEFFDEKIRSAEDVDQHLVEMVKVLKEFMMRRGKGVRPFLCWCAYMLAGGTEENKIIRAAAAIELLHYYILNLDDMADRDILRHGGPTLEVYYRTQFARQSKKDQLHYGRSFSEIAGALLNSYAHELLRTSELTEKYIVDALGILNKQMLEDTVAGWQIHFFQNLQSITAAKEDRYRKGLQLVTAQYTFVGPLLIGATLAGKRSELEKVLVTYGMHVGTAFQIKDDILGLFGDPKETGKATGNDVREGKKTLLMQYAYKHANNKDRAFLKAHIGKPLTPKDLKRIQAIIISTGSLSYSEKLAKDHMEKGVEALLTLQTNSKTSKYTNILKELAEYILLRAS